MRLRLLATAELVLVSPAALFMAALVVSSLQPVPYEPAHTAELVVQWYAGRMWTLWVLLLGLPLVALFAGSGILLYSWGHDLALSEAVSQSLRAIRRNVAMFLIAAATLAAGGILVIVVLHMLAN